MENDRGSWGSNIGFLLAAIGSAVGLGNIWGFPYKMGMGGGFTFLLVYIALAIFVGFIIMVSELALGRKTGLGPIGTYRQITRKFKWIGWLAVLSPFLIMSFYSVLGGYCLQYLSLNLAELSFGLQDRYDIVLNGTTTFSAMLTNPFGCAMFTLLFVAICYFVNSSGIAGGIEKFNKVGIPALFVMLVIVIIRAVTMPGAVEGLKYMFVPGYAVEGGFIESEPNFISVLSLAGGQMFFSLSLAMGVMITYGSFLSKKENLKKNALVIVFSDTLVAIMAGLAVIPAAVANGLASGTPLNEISLTGPTLLFVTLQDVFANMGVAGPLFGIFFYLLVFLAAITSAISLTEVVVTFFLDRAAMRGRTGSRPKVTFWVCVAIAVEALLVAIDGLGSSGIFTWPATGVWNDCFLDFMDCWSEGIAMPLGALIMSLMVGWEIKSKMVLDELQNGATTGKGFTLFYQICIMVISPIIMAMILAGKIAEFFGNPTHGYIIAGIALVVFFLIAALGKKKKEELS